MTATPGQLGELATLSALDRRDRRLRVVVTLPIVVKGIAAWVVANWMTGTGLISTPLAGDLALLLVPMILLSLVLAGVAALWRCSLADKADRPLSIEPDDLPDDWHAPARLHVGQWEIRRTAAGVELVRSFAPRAVNTLVSSGITAFALMMPLSLLRRPFMLGDLVALFVAACFMWLPAHYFLRRHRVVIANDGRVRRQIGLAPWLWFPAGSGFLRAPKVEASRSGLRLYTTAGVFTLEKLGVGRFGYFGAHLAKRQILAAIHN